MIQIPRDAPGLIACGRSGLPLLAICPAGHRRTVPFRLLKTSEHDRTPLYARPFKCRECGSGEVATLYAIETQAELDELRHARAGGPGCHAAVVPKGGLPTPSRVFSGMPDTGTDQYSIEIKNVRTGETVILTSVDMTDQEKSVVVRQLLRLSGAPAALWIEDDEPKKPF